MALLAQAATLQPATMLPTESSVDEKMCSGECPQEESGKSETEDVPDCKTTSFVPVPEAISINRNAATECVAETEPMNQDDDSTVYVAETETLHNEDPAATNIIPNIGDPTITQNPINASMGQVPGNVNVFGYSNYVTTTIPPVDTMTMNPVPQAFHSVYVQYASGAVPQTIYPTNDLSYPMYVVGRPAQMPAPLCPVPPPPNPFFFDNSTSAVCSAVASIPPPDPEPRQTWTCDPAPLPVPDLEPEPDPDPDPDPDQDAEDIITAQRLGRQSTVQWLLQNYETAEGESLRRSTLYNHYLRHCKEQNIDSVNAASFGKLIRSVFLGLRTRRLGTRGNSKYHYYGIRIKPGSKLNYVADTEFSSQAPQQPSAPSQQPKTVEQESNPFTTQLEQCSIDSNIEDCSEDDIAPLRYPIHHDGLDSQAVDIPDFPNIDWQEDCSLPMCCSSEDVDLFYDTYRIHCEELRDAVMHLNFRALEGIWRNFWKIRDNINDKCGNGKHLSAIKIYVLSTCTPVQQFIRSADYLLYQNLVDIIVPDVLRSMSRSLIRSIRSFADGLSSLLKSLLVAWPHELIKIKVSAVTAFSRTLYRYTSLNHIAQSVSLTIEDQSNLQQMKTDISNVNFRDIHERAFWVCSGENENLYQFDVALQNQPPRSLEECITNLRNFVSLMLKPYYGRHDFEKVARQFLLQWTYYSSIFMGYLTLKNATSFGSFHLVRLLCDEYVFYLVVQHVSRETGETPVAIIGDNYDKVFGGLDDYLSLTETFNSCMETNCET